MEEKTKKYGKKEHCMILYLRSKIVQTAIKSDELADIVGEISENEIEYIKRWRESAKNLSQEHIDAYINFSNEEFTNMLYETTGVRFPVSISFLFTNQKRDILAWYIMENIHINHKEVRFTDEQNYVLNYTTNFQPNKQKIMIVNAGPGTGKTTVANELAYRMRKNGVLLISYTNAAISENYKRLKLYPDIKCHIKYKDFSMPRENSTVITTVDKLVSYVFSITTQSKFTYKNEDEEGNRSHNDSIRRAINLLSTSKLTKPSVYKHIIVDESQDIDELRGELIFLFFLKLECNTLTIFGDPRQRIRSGCGAWYRRLWVDKVIHFNFDTIDYMQIERLTIEKIGFSVSHRFENNMLLELTNDISEKRPDIHHKLISLKEYPKDPVTVIPVNNNNHEETFKNIGTYILDLVKNYKIRFSQIAVISPSVEKSNSTSVTVMRMCAVFKSMGIPCVTFIETHTINAVSFLTVHSSKGKEYDIVFCVGVSSYPDPPWPIPLDEGDSLVYVMNSRAKKKLFYVASMYNFKQPRGVSDRYLNYLLNPITVGDFDEEKIPTKKIFTVTETIEIFGFQDFFKINKIDVSVRKIDTFDFALPEKPEEINVCFWGIMCGIGVETMLTNKYPEVIIKFCTGDYTYVSKETAKTMIIINGIDFMTGRIVLVEDMINTVNKDEFKEIKRIYEEKAPGDLTYREYVLVCRIVDFIHSQHMNNRYDIVVQNEIPNIIEIYRSIAKKINDYFVNDLKAEVEYRIKYSHIVGCIDIYYGDKLIELKTMKGTFTTDNMYQAYLYKTMIKCPKAYLINLQSGECCEVISSKHDHIWRYMIESYCQIHIHNDIINVEMVKKKISREGIGLNQYAVDTEYTMGHDSIIFDIASVNLSNLYQSLVSSINPGTAESVEAGNKWMDVKESLFEHSIDIGKYRENVENAISINGFNSGGTFYYYNSKIDISWLPSYTYDTRDVKDEFTRVSKIKMQLSQCARLAYIYEFFCFPVGYHEHLKPHTALSDALMLAELILCQHITLEY